MQIVRSQPLTHRIGKDSDGRLPYDSAVYDDHLLSKLRDTPLRELCTRAAGLSPPSHYYDWKPWPRPCAEPKVSNQPHRPGPDEQKHRRRIHRLTRTPSR